MRARESLSALERALHGSQAPAPSPKAPALPDPSPLLEQETGCWRPVNAACDGRSQVLPPGWIKQWDLAQQRFFYINSNLSPPAMQVSTHFVCTAHALRARC